MTEPATAAQPSARRVARLVLVGVVWGALIVWWVIYQRRTGSGTVDTAQRLVDAARGNWWAVIAYVGISLVRPLVLFPATIVTVAAGILFGPVAGVAIAAVAANASAMIGYTIGRNLRRPSEAAEVTTRLGAWTSRLRTNSFEAVLLARLLFFPYDLVNYGCGLLHVPRRSFIGATAIGTLPATVAFVLVGSSVTRLDDGLDGVDGRALAASIALIVLSLVASRLVKRRQADNTAPLGES